MTIFQIARNDSVRTYCSFGWLTLLLFVAAQVSLLIAAGVSSNIHRIQYHFGPNGQICGKSAGYQGYPYIYYPIPYQLYLSQSVCVKACPGGQQTAISCMKNNTAKDCKQVYSFDNLSNQFLIYPSVEKEGICLPLNPSYFQRIQEAVKLNFFTEFSRDMLGKKLLIFLLLLVVVAISIGVVALMRYSLFLRVVLPHAGWLLLFLIAIVSGQTISPGQLFDLKRNLTAQEAFSLMQTLNNSRPTEITLKVVCCLVGAYLLVSNLYNQRRLAILDSVASEYRKHFYQWYDLKKVYVPIFIVLLSLAVFVLNCYLLIFAWATGGAASSGTLLFSGHSQSGGSVFIAIVSLLMVMVSFSLQKKIVDYLTGSYSLKRIWSEYYDLGDGSNDPIYRLLRQLDLLWVATLTLLVFEPINAVADVAGAFDLGLPPQQIKSYQRAAQERNQLSPQLCYPLDECLAQNLNCCECMSGIRMIADQRAILHLYSTNQQFSTCSAQMQQIYRKKRVFERVAGGLQFLVRVDIFVLLVGLVVFGLLLLRPVLGFESKLNVVIIGVLQSIVPAYLASSQLGELINAFAYGTVIQCRSTLQSEDLARGFDLYAGKMI